RDMDAGVILRTDRTERHAGCVAAAWRPTVAADRVARLWKRRHRQADLRARTRDHLIEIRRRDHRHRIASGSGRSPIFVGWTGDAERILRFDIPRLDVDVLERPIDANAII